MYTPELMWVLRDKQGVIVSVKEFPPPRGENEPSLYKEPKKKETKKVGR